MHYFVSEFNFYIPGRQATLHWSQLSQRREEKSMSETARAILVPNGIVTAGEEGDAFKRVIQIIQDSDRELHPDATQGGKLISKIIRHSDTRLKMICALNYRDVMEADRLCTFKLIATTKDGKASAKISAGPNMFCLQHSCQSDPKLAALHAHTKKNGGLATKVLGGGNNTQKKRKAEQIQDRHTEAWKILHNKKMFNGDCHAETSAYLDKLGIYDACDLVELEDHHIAVLQGLMKEIARTKWLKLIESLKPVPKKKKADREKEREKEQEMEQEKVLKVLEKVHEV